MSYRGGERSESSYGQNLNKAIREGRTEKQRQRDFKQKAIMAAIQAGLQGGRGMLGAYESKQLQAKQRDHRLLESSEVYAAPEYEGRTGDPPAWLGAHGEGNTDALQREPQTEPDVISGAKGALGRQGVNRAAQAVTIGGYHSPDGLEDSFNEASSDARDIQTGVGMMKSRHIGNEERRLADVDNNPWGNY